MPLDDTSGTNDVGTTRVAPDLGHARFPWRPRQAVRAQEISAWREHRIEEYRGEAAKLVVLAQRRILALRMRALLMDGARRGVGSKGRGAKASGSNWLGGRLVYLIPMVLKAQQ